MNRVGIIKNNKGAALVMVIVAMMFVGIIAAIALTMTVGNSKSTKTTIDTSENFYSSENILNDLEMYLKKLATASATEAYAGVLDHLGTSSDIEAEFESLFANLIKTKLEGADFAGKTEIDPIDASHTFKLNLLQDVCYDRYDLITNNDEYELHGDTIPITIKYEKIEQDEYGRIVLKNVVISLVEDGYESTITTDITFNAKFPKTGKVDTSDDFTYEIDHFVMISGNDIVPNYYAGSPIFNRGNMNGDFTGNIYAYKNFVIQTNNETITKDSDGNITSRVPASRIRSNYIIAGNNIIVDKGTGAVDPGTGVINGAVSIEPINENRLISKVDTAFGTNIWTDNFKIYDGSVELKGVAGTDMNVNTYLGGNLELNGNNAEFGLKSGKGELVGYSYKSTSNGMISSTFAPKSSSIILNGLGAKLDLEKLTSLKLSGTAYTSIADLQNVESEYSSYDDASTNLNYYTQGESITYRALQALYLVPGDCISVVGHNPMTIQDVLDATGKTSVSTLDLYGLDVTIPDNVKDYINAGNPYTAQYVRYVGTGGMQGEDKVYLFWNFKTKADAVRYFNKIITTDTLYFSGRNLSDKQIKMLTEKSGFIKLPVAGNCDLYGNAIYYDGGLKTYSGSGSAAAGKDNEFGSLKAFAATSQTDNGKSLILNMFPNNRLNDTNIISDSQQVYNLVGPLTSRKEIISSTDGDGNTTEELKECTYVLNTTTNYKDGTGTKLTLDKQITYDSDYTAYYSGRQYKLITGKNIELTSFDSNTTYIVVTPGNVKISNANGVFRGMIIAGGNISLCNGLDMECLGMISYTRTDKDGGTFEVDTTEFRALLDVCIFNEAGEEDPTTGNFKLRQIFNVADTSATGGSGNGDDFVTIVTSEWKRN